MLRRTHLAFRMIMRNCDATHVAVQQVFPGQRDPLTNAWLSFVHNAYQG